MSENKNTTEYTYATLPDGVDSSNLKKIDFLFLSTPYALYSYNGTTWTSTDPVANDTKTLALNGTISITQSRCTWKLGIGSNWVPYMMTSSSVGGSTCYWNITITYYIS